MKELVNHLVLNNMDRIVERSLLHCHCKNLHSIMLLESPEQTIRLYVADLGNELYKNTLPFYEGGMSLGFHPHHCNLTLHCIKGRVMNWITEPDFGLGGKSMIMREYRYHSQITEGKQGFELVNPGAALRKGSVFVYEEGESTNMLAHTLHTVGCDPFEVSAWLVYEGKEDPSYQPVCYSTSDLESVSSEGLYQKPTRADVKRLLALAGLIYE